MEYNYKIYLLFGLVLLGLINQGLSKPNDRNDPDYVQDGQEDYDEDEDTPPENKSTENSQSETTETTQKPFFVTQHEKYNGMMDSNIELKCPAKQLSNKNVIVWYKEANVLSTGFQILDGRNSHLKVLNDSSLLIRNATQKDAGNYYCEIMPLKIRLHVELQVDEEEINNNNNNITTEEQQAPAEHNQASQVGQVTATEANSDNGCNGKISQSIILTLSTICLTSVLRI